MKNTDAEKALKKYERDCETFAQAFSLRVRDMWLADPAHFGSLSASRRTIFRRRMETTFVADDEPTLGELRRDIVHHRNAGRVHVEFRRLSPPNGSAHTVATGFVQALAMQPPEAWTELDSEGALTALIRVLHTDLAYNVPLMTLDRATGLARRFLACCGEGAVFMTNGALAQSSNGGEWSPLTGATFDTGVVALSWRRVSLLWVEDED